MYIRGDNINSRTDEEGENIGEGGGGFWTADKHKKLNVDLEGFWVPAEDPRRTHHETSTYEKKMSVLLTRKGSGAGQSLEGRGRESNAGAGGGRAVRPRGEREKRRGERRKGNQKGMIDEKKSWDVFLYGRDRGG